MKMQCWLLYDKFNNDTTVAQGVGFVEGMLGGGSAHRTNAVKQGFREGLLSASFLRCPREECDLHNNTTPHRLLESSVGCPRTHHWGYGTVYLVCGGCGAWIPPAKVARNGSGRPPGFANLVTPSRSRAVFY